MPSADYSSLSAGLAHLCGAGSVEGRANTTRRRRGTEVSDPALFQSHARLSRVVERNLTRPATRKARSWRTNGSSRMASKHLGSLKNPSASRCLRVSFRFLLPPARPAGAAGRPLATRTPHPRHQQRKHGVGRRPCQHDGITHVHAPRRYLVGKKQEGKQGHHRPPRGAQTMH